MELTAENVRSIITDCLLKEDEIVDGKPIVEIVTAQGIVNNYGFHKERLASHYDEIATLLSQINKMEEGLSFLSMCATTASRVDENGNMIDYENIWGEHPDVEGLCALAIASNILNYLMPREMWCCLPGGMPYLGYTSEYLEKKKEQENTSIPKK